MKKFIRAQRHESGFTLIELLVVILIIGVLAAIAIPVFLNQRKAAVNASLQSDLRNAVTMMTYEATMDNGRYPVAMPDYTEFSEGNLISLVPSKSNRHQFCMKGANKSNEQETYYSSVKGTFVSSATECGEMLDGHLSYASENESKKAVIVTSTNADTSREQALSSLQELGYKSENITRLSSGQLRASHLDGLSTLVLVAKWHRANVDDLDLAMGFYEDGGDVLLEGNDNVPGGFVTTAVNLTSGSARFDPTYNRTTPAFPYNFRTDPFVSDGGWNCLTGLQPSAVAISTGTAHGNTCISMFAATSGSGGQFAYVIYAKPQTGSPEFSQMYAALSWMLG